MMKPTRSDSDMTVSVNVIRQNGQDLIEFQIGKLRTVMDLQDAESIGEMLIAAVRNAESSRDEQDGPSQ